jgi:hypothetical protein
MQSVKVPPVSIQISHGVTDLTAPAALLRHGRKEKANGKTGETGTGIREKSEIRNPKSEIGGWAAFRIPNSSFRIPHRPFPVTR